MAKRDRQLGKWLISLNALILVMLTGCATTPKKVAKNQSPAQITDDSAEISKKFVGFVSTKTNSQLLDYPVNKRDAERLVRELEPSVKSKTTEQQNFIALMAARRISDQSYRNVEKVGSSMADFIMKKNIDREIPEIAKLELAITALQGRNIAMTEHWLASLLDSKNQPIKAAALNLRGLIEFSDGREPEAVNSWLLARKAVPKYLAATLNLALVSLKYGGQRFAEVMLKDLPASWITNMMRATQERLSGDTKSASSICGQVLATNTNKLTLLNCGIVEWQNSDDTSKALKMLSKASGMRGGDSEFAEKISKAEIAVRKDTKKRQNKGPKMKKTTKLMLKSTSY